MPMYLMEAEDGTEREEYYSVADAPSIGSIVWLDGIQYVRRPSFLLSAKASQRKFGPKYPYASHSLNPRIPDDVAKKDKKGHVIVKSKKHEADIAARYNMTKH